jgi:pimeloyl-ACP methyl ester carboxylesterase
VSLGAGGRLLFKVLFRSATLRRTTYRQGWRVVLFDTRAFFAYPQLAALIESTYPNAKSLDWEAMAHYFKVMPQIDITPILGKITAPTLAVTGDKDPTVPPAQAQLIARRVPHSKLVVIKGAGHMLFVENPAAYANVLNEWLQNVVSVDPNS